MSGNTDRTTLKRRILAGTAGLCGLLVPFVPIVASAQPPAALVEVTPVVERELSTGQGFVGTVTPLKKATVGSAVDGRVVEFPVNEGDRVEQGQTLAQLLTETISLELTAAEAELDLRKEELAELENGSRPEEIEQAQAQMDAAKARSEFLGSRRKRFERLYAQGGAVTEEQVQEVLSLAVAADEAYRESKAAHALAVQGPRPEKIAQARARVAIQAAVVERLKDQVSKHRVFSRFNGYVTAEHVEEGQWVNKGDPVADVAALDVVELQVYVLEDHVPYIHVGTSARIELPALPDRAFTGQVSHIVPQADVRSRTFPIKVRLQNIIEQGEPLLKSGMLARVTLPTGAKTQALLVPKDALVLGGPRPMIWMVDAQAVRTMPESPPGRVFLQAPVQSVPVELGVADGNLIQVNGEVDRNGLVVVKGNERIFPPRPDRPTMVMWSAESNSSRRDAGTATK